MQDSELGSQVPLISSDGPRHGIPPLEYGMRNGVCLSEHGILGVKI